MVLRATRTAELGRWVRKKGLVGGRLKALCKAVRGPNGPCTDCVSGGGDLVAQLTNSVVVVLLVQEATTAKLN
jgi:hypothetical protein